MTPRQKKEILQSYCWLLVILCLASCARSQGVPKRTVGEKEAQQQKPIKSQINLDECGNYIDPCPVEGGVTWQCKKRFVHGVNLAWYNWAADFGGVKAWSQNGIASDDVYPKVDAKLAEIKANGGSVVRWWVLQDFSSDAVQFDNNDNPTGIGGSFIADINKVLELAEKNDIYLMLTIFSFDNFKQPTKINGATRRSLKPIIVDSDKRQALLEKIIRPMAKAAEASPNHRRLMAWDLMNEPEWALTGTDKYGDPEFNCNNELDCVSHPQMESFFRDISKVLRDESKALISVGGSAIKWAKAWSGVDLDFYQFHTYDWVNNWYPYTKGPSQYGVTDKPVVMGEYPLTGIPNIPVLDMLQSFLNNGYGGALGWSVSDQQFQWSQTKQALKNFSLQNTCTTKY